MDIITGLFYKVLCVVLSLFALLPANTTVKKIDTDRSDDKTNYPYVFVAGFWGWGEYSEGNDAVPYWGGTTGNMLLSLNNAGYVTAASDVNPVGSAWDRACELYAQITGSVVDYGKAHSLKYGHDRYGEDYTGRGLVEKWDSENKINIISHSFGGPTVALFISLLEYGCEEEISATVDGSISPLFTGGKGNTVYSATGIAGAYNGTTMTLQAGALTDALYYMSDFALCEDTARQLSYFADGNVGAPDTALYDMSPDNAAALNETIKTVDSVYYFTVPCCDTKISEITGRSVADISCADPTMLIGSALLGSSEFTTDGGLTLGSEWQPNDGVVNTVSQYAPFNAECIVTQFTPSQSEPSSFTTGKYYSFSVYRGSHNTLMGGVVRTNNEALDYIADIIDLINGL